MTNLQACCTGPARHGYGLLLLALAALAALSLLAACTAATGDVAEADEVAIYSAVIRRIYTQDDTFGGTLNAPTVYLVSTTDDGAGDPDVERLGAAIDFAGRSGGDSRSPGRFAGRHCLG